MAIKNIIAKGIGYNPGTSSFIVTHGFGDLGVGGPVGPAHHTLTRRGRRRMLIPFILTVLQGMLN